jgi:hypothetical protein
MRLKLDLRAALLLVLDQVDYMHGACSITDAVGAVLPPDVIEIARAAIVAHDKAAAHSQD